jgi:hypothetical protein
MPKGMLGCNKDTCSYMFIAALLIAKLWKQPRCPTTDKRIKKCGTYIKWKFIQPPKSMKFSHFLVNNGSGEHYLK